MGDAADMILEGLVCQGCGDLFDDHASPGYPRNCAACGGEEGPKPPTKRWWRCKLCKKGCRSEQGLADHTRDVHEKRAPRHVDRGNDE